MLNLLNEVNFFGNWLNWDSRTTAIWLIVIQAVFAVVAISLIIFLILYRWNKKRMAQVVYTEGQPSAPTPEVERELTGISLDLGVVQREFAPGDEFNCDGLILHAAYSDKSVPESIIDYTLVDGDEYERLETKKKLNGVYVIKPLMYSKGKKVVTVKYDGKTVVYTISVNQVEEVVEAQPEPVVQPEPTTIYVEKPVEEKTRELMSIFLNADNVKKEYTVGDSIDHEGLIVMARFNVEPLEEEVTDYAVLTPDMSKPGKPTVTITYQGKTVGYQIVVNPAEEPQPVVSQEVVVEQPIIVQRPDPIIVEEESISSRLRYDKSFTARLIQSDDEIKYWYTDFKNELLSYKSVHSRISWKRETYKWHKDPIAKFAYRGKQLCIFLPLNPAEYIEEYNHPVEDASDMACYEDTPLMIRLKSKRRVKFAMQLIAKIMEDKGIKRVEHETVDYYMPYEGIVELIRKGLIKREIKSPEDEKLFDKEYIQSSSPDTGDDSIFDLTEVAPGIYVTKK